MKINRLGAVLPTNKKKEEKKKGKQKSIKALYSTKAKGLLYVVALIPLSACTAGTGLSWHGDDYFKLEGTPAGIAAFDEYQNGILTNGRISPDLESPAWQVKKKRIDYRILLEQSRINKSKQK